MSAAPLARVTDPITSDLAAEGVDRAGSRRRVLRLLTEHGPLADVQLVEKDGGVFTPQRLRTARKELEKEKVVRDTGRKIETDRNRRKTHHTVWEVAS